MRRSISHTFSPNTKAILVIFLLSLIIMSKQLVTCGYFSVITEDVITYTSWAWQFASALHEGLIYPRWMSLDFWGYGSPTFILYSPLAFYFSSFFHIITGSIPVAMNLTKFAALLLSGIGLYFFAKEFYSYTTAVLTAVVYILLPFNVLQLYIQGSFASTVSWCWFSPLLLFTYKHLKTGRYGYLLYAGAGYGGLLLTHLISAYMFTFILIAFISYFSITEKNVKGPICLIIIMTIGFLISAAYILPLITERRFINITAFISSGSGFRFSDFFVAPNSTSRLPADLFWPVYYNTFVLHVIFFAIIMLLSFAAEIKGNIISSSHNKLNCFLLWVLFITLFLLFGVSDFIWKHIPLFSYIQFPTRWLNISSFAASILLASFMNNNNIQALPSAKHRTLGIVTLLLMFIIIDYNYITKAKFFPETSLIPVRSVNWTDEHLPIKAVISNINKHELISDNAITTKGNGQFKTVVYKSSFRDVNVFAYEPLMLRFKSFNFPGWTAYVDGKYSTIATENSTGAILVYVPKGEHRIQVILEDTPVRLCGKIISIVSMIFLILFIAYDKLFCKLDL